MALEEVLDQMFGAGRHMDLCTARVVNCGMGVDQTMFPTTENGCYSLEI
jgi:hypothetical protein